MATMTSFCRITGHARNLPKPCYFPLLPPLSPADAKKLCRITGRVTDSHNYSPIIAFGKPYRFDGLEGCKITRYENLSFSRPTFISYKENEKTLENLTQVLDKMKAKKKKKVDVNRVFVYRINDQPAGVVIPPELEEAIRTGEIETLSLSKDIQYLSLKIKQGRTVKVQMEAIPKSEVNVDDNYYYGEGQSREVLEEQQKILNERNKRKQDTMARKKLFEMKEQKAEEELKKATERPKSKKPPIKFDPIKRKQKLEKMSKMMQEQQENDAIILPKFDLANKVNPDEQIRFEKMLEDLVKSQKSSVNVTTVFSSNFDWAEMEKAESAGFDWDSFPHENICGPVEITVIDINTQDITSIPKSQPLNIAAAVETVDPAPPVEQELLIAIKHIEEEKLKTTEKVADAIKGMESTDILPSISDVGKIISEAENLLEGYLVKEKDAKGSKFIKKEEYTVENGPALSGAMITIENQRKFVPGMIIYLAKKETFVAGQTIETPEGRHFIPGQTVVDKNGDISFIPGQRVSTEEGNTFVAGHIIDKEDGPQFLPGQMVDRGDQKPVFMSGQTILTEHGPKFVPGEIITDSDGYQEFVPGIKMPTSKGEKFIPGQAFQSASGISFTPGQIIDTEEGPSFIPGKSFETPEGDKRFVRGEMIKTDDGKISFEASKIEFEIPLIEEDLVESDDENAVIPNEDLQLLAVTAKDVTGFVVKPSNTFNIQVGEKLYGDIVETDTSVLFYLSGKLPNDKCIDAKIISGQLVVGEIAQKFVPGKMMNTMDGEKFIPGQIVKTNLGDEFVPGQIVETADGIKFVPGQIAMTSEGEKFVPGQVVVGEDGPKFVPGQIIQTKNGATFIPGQMMETDKGQKFVPGQLVETREGPMFVPGQVIETNEGPKFISGTVVETEEGLKYLPNVSTTTSTTEESEEDSEISFQGFDISPEEIQLLTLNVTNARPRSPIRKEQGLIDSFTLKKLAADTMIIHGRTPEPNADKKKKKKKGKITIDALEEDKEKDETETEDLGTNKVEILKVLIKAGTSVSSLRKEKELRKLNELLNMEETHDENETEIEAIKFINSSSSKEDLFELYIGNDEDLVEDILFSIGNVDNVQRNDQVTNLVNDAIKKVITKKCDEQIEQLISKININPESLFTDCKAQILLTEAVGIVCVTGDVEVASLLEKFISEPTNPNCLKDDKDVLAVLRQVLVLHRIAERDPKVAKVLQELRDDPEGVKDRNRIRRLIKEAKTLLVREKKASNKTFDVRHVTSSKDIPKEIFEQIRKDKDEAEKFMEKLPDELFQAIIADERCSKLIKSLKTESDRWSSKEIEKFKKGMAVVVAKDNLEAVIPKYHARSIYYGIMPYLLIDEAGFKFFERGLTGRKLAPSRVIENTWFQPDSYYDKAVLYPQRVTPSGTQYNLVLLGDSYRNSNPSIQYTSLLPSSGPTRISYLESQRRASRDGSITPLRRSSRSTTPSRRFSLSALHDPYSSGTDSFFRRHSMATSPIRLTKGLSPIKMDSDLTGLNNYSPKSPHIYENDLEQTSITRSGTIGRLLDKYSKYSPSGGYENSKSLKSYEKYNPLDSYLQNGDDEKLNKYNLTSSSLKSRTSSVTPDRSEELPTGRYGKDRFTDFTLDDAPLREQRALHRPFSDIYETDEIESSTNDNENLSRNLLMETAKKNYDALDSIYEQPLSAREGRISYSDRLREWKNRQNKLHSKEPEDKTSRSSRSRYGSVISEDDDRPLDEKNDVKRPSRERKDLEEKNLDDFSIEKFRESLRQKYSQQLDDLNKNLNIAYKTSSPTRTTRFEKSSAAQPEEDVVLAPRKTKRYAGSASDSVGPRKISNQEEEIGNNFRKGSLDIDYDSRNMAGYRPYYGYGGGYGSRYEQPPLYGQPMEYGQYNAPPMYEYHQPGSYRGYTGSPMSRGSAMSMYSPMSPYGTAGPSRFGGGHESPMSRYGSAPGAYSGYRHNPSTGYRNTPYQGPLGGSNRRFTTALTLSDDDNDDDDLGSYDPKRGQRQLASRIARKYVGDSDDDAD